MPKLVLINPSAVNFNIARQGFKVQPLNLAYLAALSSEDWEIKIYDENFEEALIEKDADLVGITTLTSTINRAYELSIAYRREKIPVVLGGIHVSCVPDEALQFCDSVVIGEAESVWRKVLYDCLQNKLRKKYNGVQSDFKTSIFPRRDLLSNRYKCGSIQTSRGCPLDCEFCSVKAFYGSKFRQM